nr:immunoglobulin heavy chain junction region [Macaca mulatta]MOY21670.1 immunoglobulin heavy chain junction region [Macaca mulatta]MOY21760.1 immunoglobulin heavy chain junction region [Macaca mulatta]MOY22403.1 immunoglobulin heavy chain junction region [Macaca mulatta]MOY22413.1 immunoglobulin heavy chain junction region [Macaca mulatta]
CAREKLGATTNYGLDSW